MSQEILCNPEGRQALAREILQKVVEETAGVVGFLGIGSFWRNGPLATFGGDKKDIDLFAVADFTPAGLPNRKTLALKIKEAFIREGIVDLEVDCGMVWYKDKLSYAGSLAPEVLLTLSESKLIVGKEPINLPALRKMTPPAMFIN